MATSVIRLLLFLTMIAPVPWAFSQTSEEPANFLRLSDASGQFMGLQRDGDGNNRKPVTYIFEEIGAGERFRKLHEIVLVNSISPGIAFISGDGRFLVAIGDVLPHDANKHAIVVYDMVRKEHTIHALSSYLSDETRRRVSSRGGAWPWVGGYEWPVFSKDSSKFYPTLPETAEKENVPFVEVDLKAKKVSVLPISDESPKEMVRVKLVASHGGQVFDMNNWFCSTETVTVGDRVLPKLLRRTWPTRADVQVFELDSTTVDYVRVSQEKWKDGDPFDKKSEVEHSQPKSECVR